ncbi:MAG: methyltransferase domain-containing protein [Candidatus Omnitrophica bacterium]|nr:methyltransferase domain-containing protein [Candidatus Omnitrophota bacterium]MDD5573573.1 methyltransferase domain-containing protein [Candidatus Omnitrophota bacterium]
MESNGAAPDNVAIHFMKRAGRYNGSSAWVEDPALIAKIREAASAGPEDTVLDIAVGTGKISRAFLGRVGRVVGLDICPDMVCQARGCVDEIVLSPAERLPFKDGEFDACVCRQGLQFMEVDRVVAEVHRVLKPGGRAVFCHLTAYGPEDREETFLIQKLRNPARKNFFLPQDIPESLNRNAFTNIEVMEYITRESVNRWIDHGVLAEEDKEKIREAYLKASDVFKRIHDVQWKDGDIFDSMRMTLVRAVR